MSRVHPSWSGADGAARLQNENAKLRTELTAEVDPERRRLLIQQLQNNLEVLALKQTAPALGAELEKTRVQLERAQTTVTKPASLSGRCPGNPRRGPSTSARASGTSW